MKQRIFAGFRHLKGVAMAREKAARFQISTVLPELVNQRIESIETRLKEVALTRRGGRCVAAGLVERWICFRQSGMQPGDLPAAIGENGFRLRSRQDQFYFSVILSENEAWPEDDAPPETELRQEFFTFHPGGNQQPAVLQQGFVLLFQEAIRFETPCHEELEKVQIERVVGRGNGVVFLGTSFSLPCGATPKTFEGCVTTGAASESPYDLSISGTLIYRLEDGQLAETALTREIFCSDMELPDQAAKPLQFCFTLSDYHFRRGPAAAEWHLVLKTDYHWLQLQTETLSYPVPAAGKDEATVTALVPIPVASYEHHFLRTFFLTMPDMLPHEIQCTILRREEQITAKGLLLNIALEIGICGIDGNQCEIFQTANFQTEELLVDIPEIHAAGTRLLAEVKTRAGMFVRIPSGIRLPVTFDYQIRVSREEMRTFARDETAGEWIFAKLLCGEKSLYWQGEQPLPLEGEPDAMQKVASCLAGGKTDHHRGWLDFKGEIQLTLDDLNPPRLRSRTLSIPVRESFFWEELPERSAIESRVELETDAIRYLEGAYFYQYLMKLSCKAWVEKPVRIRTNCHNGDSDTVGIRDFPGVKAPGTAQELEIRFQKTLSFRNGFPNEFVENELRVTSFDCYRANNRLFISGILAWHSAYWDRKGLLRKENREIPFWQYHDQALGNETRNINPRIRSFTVEPAPARSWFQRGSPHKAPSKKKGNLMVSLELLLEEV